MGYVKDIAINNNTYLIEPILYAESGGTSSALTAVISNFELVTGVEVTIKMGVSNAQNATLSVNSTGNKLIQYDGINLPAGLLEAGKVYKFVYDGTYWQVVGIVGAAGSGPVSGVKGNAESSYRSGNVNLTPEHLGLGNGKLYYGTCTSAATATALTVTCSGFTLATGNMIAVYFQNNNTSTSYSSLTMNVNGTRAVNIKTITGGSVSNLGSLALKGVCLFVYNGTYWILLNYNTNTTYNVYKEVVNCTTAAATAAKVGSVSTYEISSGKHFGVFMYYSNSAVSALTLNIGSKGAKPVYINGSPSSSENYILPAGFYIAWYDTENDVYHFRTDGKLPGDISGDAATVNGHTVNADVPSDAVFTDTTYTAASSSAMGLMSASDYTKLAGLPNTAFDLGAGTAIASGSDLNNFITPGNYRVADASVSATISNAPTTSSGYMLKVFYTQHTAILYQLLIAGTNGYIYLRSHYTVTGAWSNWINVQTTPIFNFQPQITNNADLNSYTNPGVYRCAGPAVAATLSNSPITNTGFILEVYNNGGLIIHLMISSDGNGLYTRRRNTSNAWSGWYRYNVTAV